MELSPWRFELEAGGRVTRQQLVPVGARERTASSQTLLAEVHVGFSLTRRICVRPVGPATEASGRSHENLADRGRLGSVGRAETQFEEPSDLTVDFQRPRAVDVLEGPWQRDEHELLGHVQDGADFVWHQGDVRHAGPRAFF